MNETLTPQAALQEFAAASRNQDSLAHRTEGLGWLVWAAVVPGILLTLQALDGKGLPMAVVMLAWVPWLLLGYVTTHLLWRSAALEHAHIQKPSLLSYVVKIAIIAGLLLALHFAIKPDSMAPVMAFIGVAWIAIGLFTRRLSRQGRLVCFVGGGLVVLGAIVLAILALPMDAGMAYAVLALGIVPAALGSYQSLSG